MTVAAVVAMPAAAVVVVAVTPLLMKQLKTKDGEGTRGCPPPGNKPRACAVRADRRSLGRKMYYLTVLVRAFACACVRASCSLLLLVASLVGTRGGGEAAARPRRFM